MSRFLFPKREEVLRGFTTGRPNGVEMSRVAVWEGRTAAWQAHLKFDAAGLAA